jgi:hypothetical protein
MPFSAACVGGNPERECLRARLKRLKGRAVKGNHAVGSTPERWTFRGERVTLKAMLGSLEVQ